VAGASGATWQCGASATTAAATAAAATCVLACAITPWGGRDAF
jgi:hypothetical protein